MLGGTQFDSLDFWQLLQFWLKSLNGKVPRGRTMTEYWDLELPSCWPEAEHEIVIIVIDLNLPQGKALQE
jgi:hypothetical protein